MVIDRNGGTLKILGLPWGLWAFLAGYALSGIVWGVRLDFRVTQLEQQNAQEERRIDRIDAEGTRKLIVIEDRQNNASRRIDEISRRVDGVMQYFKGAPPP